MEKELKKKKESEHLSYFNLQIYSGFAMTETTIPNVTTTEVIVAAIT